MNYELNAITHEEKGLESFKKLLPLIAEQKREVLFASIAILVNSGLNLLAPYLMGVAIDRYVATGNFHGVLVIGGIIFAVYVIALVAQYLQTRLMGAAGQAVLFDLRGKVFDKLSELPVAFFNQNKAGDLISRVNNDTDKLNQFFSRGLMQFIGSIFLIIGSGIFIVAINWKLGLAALIPAAILVTFTQLISPWVKRKTAASLKSYGGLSAEVAESLDNFKVIVAFNRRDYFRERFDKANEENYTKAVTSGIVSNIFFTPVYTFAANVAQLTVLGFGIALVASGDFTVGLLISYFVYLARFYDPLRQIAMVWAEFQTALAGWDRISDILNLNSNLSILPAGEISGSALLEFNNVHFGYVPGTDVLHAINLRLEPGKTYALVGPTGGGKTTTASLMARLYDPTQGEIRLSGRDIRSYSDMERTRKIGFILQEPFLFGGTLTQNIVYGNDMYGAATTEEVKNVLETKNLVHLLDRFPEGLETVIGLGNDALSLGQKQLVAFMRAVLRAPELLILDEATANIDTVTEQILEEILEKLPAHTTKVIIAHRLNTIANADVIYFVNGGSVKEAGSMKDAVEMLMHGKRQS